MSIPTVLSVNTLLNKAVEKLNLTSLGQVKNSKQLDTDTSIHVKTPKIESLEESLETVIFDLESIEVEGIEAEGIAAENIEAEGIEVKSIDGAPNTDETSVSLKEKMLKNQLMANYQPHLLHYAIKGMGCLPSSVLESLVGYLHGPVSKQYSHVDAHLRLILAVNSKLKTPLQLSEIGELRKRFATDAVAMQAPKVWQQKNDSNLLSNIKPFIKKDEASISWEDRAIANADDDDDDDMKLRCYQKKTNHSRFGFGKQQTYNADETVLLFFHGGGFCIGDVDTHHEFCHAICEQTGWSVVSVDYRLAPENPAPAALRDCISAYAWLAKNCQLFGALPSRIVLAGDSAGGGLSTMIAQQIINPSEEAWSDLGADGQKTFTILQGLPHPLAQMPLYPVTDIDNNYPSWELYGEGLLLDHADIAVFDAACLGNSLLSRQHILTSPMLGDNRSICPTYVVAAELDVLRDEALAYAEQLQAHGVIVQTYTVVGAPHGFIHFMSVHQALAQETEHIIDGFASFVRDVIKTQNTWAA